MTSEPRLETSIKQYLAPLLRGDGFLGSGSNFRRLEMDHIHVFNVQKSIYGGEFYVNLAIQPIGINDVLGGSPNPKKITESLCEFRSRMTESSVGRSWKHDGTQASMDNAIRNTASVYESCGRSFFRNFSGPESPIRALAPAEFRVNDKCFHGIATTKVRLSLTLARLRLLSGNVDDAREFAKYGLEQVDPTSFLGEQLQAIILSADSIIR